MITLTTEQAQQIEEAVAFAASHSEYLADDLILYGEALATIRAARAQGNALMSYKEKAESVNAILAGSHISRGNKQLADWLMRCPQTGEKLRLAGAPEQFGHMSRVRLRDSDGNDWTLTAGLQEGWLTEEQRLANLAVAIAEETEAARAQEQPHPDDEAVDRFAAAMKAKLEKKRAEGRGGWEDKNQCSAEFLNRLLNEHVGKGDPVDVGNLAMMLWNRGERTEAIAQEQAEQEPVPTGATHYQPHQKTYYKRVSATEWYLWSCTGKGWLPSKGTSDSSEWIMLSPIQAHQPAKPAEQEPVGRWNWNEAKFEWLTKFDYHKHHMTPLYAAPQPVMQEPVAWAHPSGGYLSARYMKEFATGLEKETYTIPLYAAHVRTKDLTDDEIFAFDNKAEIEPLAFARAVIAADREKNK